MGKGTKKVKKGKSASKMIADAKKDLAIVKVKAELLPKATPEEAKKRTDHIKELFQTMGNTWWEIGEEIERAVNDRVPQALGESFSSWMISLFGEGAWQKMRRAFIAVKATKDLEHETRVKISEGNAYNFSRLPEKQRKDPEWVKKAQKMDNDAFKAATDRFREKKTGLKDPMLKLVDAVEFNTVPKSLFIKIQQVMKLAAQVEQLDLKTKEGKIDALEAIFAEYETNDHAMPEDLAKVKVKPKAEKKSKRKPKAKANGKPTETTQTIFEPDVEVPGDVVTEEELREMELEEEDFEPDETEL